MNIKDISIKVSDTLDRVVGYLGDREIMSVGKYRRGEWSVGMSTCLPTNLDEAILFIEVMNKVVAKTEELGGKSCAK